MLRHQLEGRSACAVEEVSLGLLVEEVARREAVEP